MKFRTSQAGYITGIRFYKGTGNTGTHTGSLWAANGTKLASASFTGETATGWQTATFGAPRPVAANTTYVASYYAPVGRYANNGGYFASAATTRGPLTALSNGSSGGNGVYRYGASGFPNSTYQSTNYWVDVVFETSSTDTIAPTVVAQTPSADGTGVAVSTTVSAQLLRKRHGRLRHHGAAPEVRLVAGHRHDGLRRPDADGDVDSRRPPQARPPATRPR